MSIRFTKPVDNTVARAMAILRHKPNFTAKPAHRLPRIASAHRMQPDLYRWGSGRPRWMGASWFVEVHMAIWAAIPVLVLSVLASGPFRDSMPVFVEPLAQLAAVLSLFILVCSIEAGGGSRNSHQ
jgi:hypothetical protein